MDTDEHGLNRQNPTDRTRVNPCPSVVKNGSLRIYISSYPFLVTKDQTGDAHGPGVVDSVKTTGRWSLAAVTSGPSMMRAPAFGKADCRPSDTSR